MASKKVKVKQMDAAEVTKLQIITGAAGTAVTYGAHPNKDDRVKVPDGTVLVVLDALIRGTGISNPDYYYIEDVPANGNFRRYFVKVADTVAA